MASSRLDSLEAEMKALREKIKNEKKRIKEEERKEAERITAETGTAFLDLFGGPCEDLPAFISAFKQSSDFGRLKSLWQKRGE